MKPEGDITALCRSVQDFDPTRATGEHNLEVPDEPLEERCDRICRIGKNALGVRVAAVSIFSGNKQRFKSVSGWRISELPMDHSLCRSIRETGKPLIVSDLGSDPRFKSARLVAQAPSFRFYAGYPIIDSAGEVVGTFCVFDVAPKVADKRVIMTLTDLALLAQRELRTADLWDAQNQLVSKLGEARRQALLDGLTGVWNRRGGIELLDMMLDRARTTRERFAVCMVDVDYFKTINDKLGHTVGDQVLTKIAATISDCVRPNDIVVRYGGDEFMLILREADPDVVRSVARRISDQLDKADLPKIKGRKVPTLSFGCAVNDPQENLAAGQLIDRADKALYRTKHQGRDGMTLWSGGLRMAVR